jgi:hypothetical protein
MKTGLNTNSAAADGAAFTRVDLLAVGLVILVVSTLSLRLTANTGVRANSVVCQDNLRRLTRGWALFAEDNRGVLPGNQPGGPASVNWAVGNLDYFGGNTDNTNTANLLNAQIGRYVGDALAYRCPSDLTTVTKGGTRYLRVRSYSMSGAFGDAAYTWIPNGYRNYKNIADIYNPPPSQCFVFMDEHAGSINDCYFAVTISDARSAKMIDFPASRHDRCGSLSFADGHTELHRWFDERTTPSEFNANFPLNVAQPNNADLIWLMARTTAK